MYPEFIAIYVGLVIVIGLLIALLILGSKILNKLQSRPSLGAQFTSQPTMNAQPQYRAPMQQGAIVFCKNCATQYDANTHVCPKCGTPR